MIIQRSFRRLPRLPLSHLVRQLSSLPPYKEEKIKVLDANLNCIETLGNSANAHPIFFLPGTFGSIEMDFKPIIPMLNTEKYKWLSYDPPGYGKSRPPKREFQSKYGSVYALDVPYIKEIMEIFKFPRYTLLAWSGAGLSGISIASEEPEKVAGLITWGAFGHVKESAISATQIMKELGLTAIPEGRRKHLINMYGEACLLEMWIGWCDESQVMAKSDVYKFGGTFQQKIQGVRCPSLIIQGMKDKLIEFSHAEYLNQNLANSRIHIMENGTHNLHLRETKEFLRCIEDFVDSNCV